MVFVGNILPRSFADWNLLMVSVKESTRKEIEYIFSLSTVRILSTKVITAEKCSFHVVWLYPIDVENI